MDQQNPFFVAALPIPGESAFIGYQLKGPIGIQNNLPVGFMDIHPGSFNHAFGLPDIFIERHIPTEGEPAVEPRFLETRRKRRATGQRDRQNKKEKKLFESSMAHRIHRFAMIVGFMIHQSRKYNQRLVFENAYAMQCRHYFQV